MLSDISAECHYGECCLFMLSVILLSVITQRVIMLSDIIAKRHFGECCLVMLSVILLSVIVNYTDSHNAE